MGFFEKLDFFFKINKSGKFSVEFVSNGTISRECLFYLNCEVFLRKIRKFLELEKLENMVEYFGKKCFLFKRHLYQNAKPENGKGLVSHVPEKFPIFPWFPA